MLVVSGVVVRCLEDSFFRDDDEAIGEAVRMFAGNLGSTERTGKRAYRTQVLFLTAAEETALRAVIPLGNQVTVSGEGIIGGPITAAVRVGRSQPFEYAVGGALALYYVADITLREV